MSKSKFHLNPIVSDRVIVYENNFQQVYKVNLDFGICAKDLFVTDYGQRVGVMVISHKGILLTRQYRYLIDQVSWEIPGGKVDKNEVLEVAAIRECLEETGILCHNLKLLLMFQPGLDALHNPTHLFYTHDFDDNCALEKIQCEEIWDQKWVTFDECISMIFSKMIVDSLSVIALLSYKALLGKVCKSHPIEGLER
jgi:ADP-ribose pyrophosphatase